MQKQKEWMQNPIWVGSGMKENKLDTRLDPRLNLQDTYNLLLYLYFYSCTYTLVLILAVWAIYPSRWTIWGHKSRPDFSPDMWFSAKWVQYYLLTVFRILKRYYDQIFLIYSSFIDFGPFWTVLGPFSKIAHNSGRENAIDMKSSLK